MIKIGNYNFEGPYRDTEKLKDRSGVYAILCPQSQKTRKVIDIGESAQVKTRVQNHDREDCWQRHCRDRWLVAVYYTTDREDIEKALRQKYQPPCGDR